jgi:flagellar motility protein MotE (MotC chaperone)
MTDLAAARHVSKSKRRFLTFGGALILAACLTVLKITLIALDVTDRSDAPWPDLSVPQATVEAPPTPVALDESKFVPWPAVTPEPAAGPDDEGAGSIEPEQGAVQAIDPKSLTPGQIEALQHLAERSKELDERERLLDMRSEVNGRTEEKLDRQIQRLAALKAELEALMAGLDEEEELKLARLVKIYETMKPKAAAEIFNRLEIPVLLHVVERMKEAKSAVVLGKMNPAIAKRVTTELAKRKERPDPGDDGLGG